jgi:Fe-S-cluster-containing dehydrogenase component
MDRVPALKQRMLMLTDYQTCSGCQSCLLACSLAKAKAFSPTKSRITLRKIEERCLGIPIVCEHCEEPPCIPACPTSAINKDPKTGIVRVNSDLCTGCKQCSLACPLGPETVRFIDGKAVLCDLCDGDPACVKTCTQKALMFLPTTKAVIAKKAELAEKRKRILASTEVS